MLAHTLYQRIWACFCWCKTEILKYQFGKILKGLFFFFPLPSLIFYLGELSAIQMVSLKGNVGRKLFFFFIQKSHHKWIWKGCHLEKTCFRRSQFECCKGDKQSFFFSFLFFLCSSFNFSKSSSGHWMTHQKTAFRTFYFGWNISHCALQQWFLCCNSVKKFARGSIRLRKKCVCLNL